MTKLPRVGRLPLLAAAVLLPVVALAGVGAHALHAHTPPQSEAELRERMNGPAERVFEWTNATPDQQARIGAILDDAAAGLWERHDEREARHAEIRAILTADTIDRKALEQVRRDVVDAFDEVSKDIVGYVGDVAEILSPEQRQALAAHHDELRGIPE